MAGALRKTMVYLGLAEDDDRYDDDDDVEGYDDDRRRSTPSAPSVRPSGRTGAAVTPAAAAHARSPGSCATPRSVALNRITTIHPRTYNEAKTIGESFRDGIPVIMNLTDMDDADAKRLVDFAAGLVFGLHGSIERVTAQGLPAVAGARRGRHRRGRGGPDHARLLQPVS